MYTEILLILSVVVIGIPLLVFPFLSRREDCVKGVWILFMVSLIKAVLYVLSGSTWVQFILPVFCAVVLILDHRGLIEYPRKGS